MIHSAEHGAKRLLLLRGKAFDKLCINLQHAFEHTRVQASPFPGKIDPDGTLIEFVETHKIPVAKKLGWFIDMRRRDPRKPLPKFLFQMMGLVSRGKKREE